MRFFWAWRDPLHPRLRCIRSWSRVTRYRQEYAGDKLLPEIQPALGIVKHEYPRCRMLHDRLCHAGEIKPQRVAYIYNAEHHTPHEAEAVEQISKYERLNTPYHGVKPYQPNRCRHIDIKRYAQWAENQHLQHGAYDKKPHRSTQHLAYEEKPCPGAMGKHSEPLIQITVNRRQIAPVEKRQQHSRDEHVPDHKTEHHLQVTVTLTYHHPGHRYESHTRNGGSYHGYRHQRPWVTTAASKKRLVGAAA